MATIEVVMPKMGESIMEGTIISWFKQPGDRVELDETLLEIGTDKVDSEIPSPAAGVLKEILVPEGETVDVGTPIALIAANGEEDAPAQESQAAPSRPEPATPAPVAAAEEENQPVEDQPAADQDRFYSPLVRSIADKEGIPASELETIEGSGKEGRVTKKDLLKYLEERPAEEEPTPRQAPAPAAPPPPSPPSPARPSPAPKAGDRSDIIEMDRMRQIIAEHMVRSKATSPHVTSFAEVDVSNLVSLRERNKEAFAKREGVKLTYTPFFVHAAIEALREHPLLNASVEEKQIILKKDYHVGIAVALGKSGLIVPIVRNAGEKNVVGIARAVADLAERARNKQLQPDELQGGTFTVTNVGSLGSIMGTPIINQPQVAILAIGAIKKRPVVVEVPGVGDLIAIRHIMYLSLSYDHRIIDGAMSASFLQTIIRSLEGLDPDAEL